ncbi:MAG TPA: hypothetical protein VLK84_22075 [Longimicrobium sp.]|nr:hypothetical protein [Longimicrobium sp.]
MAFRYSGVGKRAPGSYRAVGDIDPRVKGAQPGDWAYGSASAHSPPRVQVHSVRRHTDGGRGFDGVTVSLPDGVRAGQTVPFREPCEASPGCARMTIELGMYPNVGYPEVHCTLVSGSVHLTHVNGERVRGSFTGTAACDGFQSGRMQVERGSFDVPIVDLLAN